MNISDLLSGNLGQQVIDGISQQVGTSKEDTSSVVNSATPVLLGMLKNNASSKEGAAGILSALNEHDGGILDNLGGFLNSGNTTDGENILGHILGDKKQAVENQLSRTTGVSNANVSKIIAMLAPIVMGQLGKQAGSGNVSSEGGINDLLGNLIGGGNSSGLAGNILGSVLGGGNKKSGGGLGDMIGGILGKK